MEDSSSYEKVNKEEILCMFFGQYVYIYISIAMCN